MDRVWGPHLPLQILDDLVSRKHFRVLFEESTGRYYAEDMQSKHGTFLNLRKIEERSLLNENDRIVVGETTLLFTERDFDTKESALLHWKKAGEKAKTTLAE